MIGSMMSTDFVRPRLNRVPRILGKFAGVAALCLVVLWLGMLYGFYARYIGIMVACVVLVGLAGGGYRGLRRRGGRGVLGLVLVAGLIGGVSGADIQEANTFYQTSPGAPDPDKLSTVCLPFGLSPCRTKLANGINEPVIPGSRLKVSDEVCLLDILFCARILRVRESFR